MRRRDVLKVALASAMLPRAAFAATPRSPRYFVSIFLSGGLDAIYTTDPKSRADVESWVDVPYRASEIVHAGSVALGPHFAALAPWASRLAVVNGVAVRTANHQTGMEQFLRMKTRTSPEMPTLFDLIGESKEGQALGSMSWSYGAPQFKSLFQDTAPGDLRSTAYALRNQARGVRRARTPEGRVTAKNLEESAALFERLAELPRLEPEAWAPEEFAQHVAASLQRALFALEHDLTRCIELNLGGIDQPWDSHTFNTERQGHASTAVPMIARFLAELDRKNLASKTLVILGSELGRHPGLNRQSGKDHFPEAPFVFIGPRIESGVFGRTGRMMQSLPVSLRTGKDVAASGHTMVLDDIGTTLLRMAGVADPSTFGYGGRVLEFLGGA